MTQLADALADRYRLVREAGRGGMATVYLAEDLKHGRSVAVKVLHPELAAALGTERFLAEIRTIATLQHPNILPLFDSGEAAGFVYYVMPFVEGESLRERLVREQQLPVDEAVRLAQQVAMALEHAHRRGVIHRDIKPENILLSEGQPLVADFGIALAVASAGGTRLTQSGISVGTPQYMSPEQAAAERDVDRRSDIYSLGALLYEMLAGQPPWTGPTAAAITARKMTEPVPPLRNIRETVSAPLEAVIRKALARTPADRFSSALQFHDALELTRTLSGESRLADAATMLTPAAGTRRDRLPWIVAAGAVVVGMLAMTWAIVEHRRGPGEPAVPVEFSLAVDPLAVSDHGPAPVVAFSPDGRMLAYVSGEHGDGQLYVRRLDGRAAVAVPGATRAMGPFFSPDGEWIAYGDASDATLRKVRLDGGAPVTLCKAPEFHGGSWGSRGMIAYSADVVEGMFTTIGIWTVSADGGTPRMVARPDSSNAAEAWYAYPSFLPDGRSAIFSVLGGNAIALRIAVVDVTTAKQHTVVEHGGWARYVTPDYLVFAQDGALLGARFDAASATVTGKPVTIRTDVMMNLPMEMGLGHFDVSSAGTLAYLAGQNYLDRAEGIAWADRSGRLEPLPNPGIPLEHLGMHTALHLSPDGKRLLVSGMTGPLPDFKGYPMGSALYLYDLARGSVTRLSPERPSTWFGLWMPDGLRVVVMASEDTVPAVGLFLVRSDGLGTPEQLTRAPAGRFDVPWSVSPDGTTVLYYEHSGNGAHADIYAVPLAGAHESTPVFNKPNVYERDPAISPDGRWLAYVTDETGTSEVYLTNYPERTRRWPVSSGGGAHPAWNSNNRELFFSQADVVKAFQLWSIAVAPSSPEPLGKQQLLFENARLFNQLIAGPFEPAPGGSRFLVLLRKPLEAAKIDRLTVVVNWTSELRAAIR